MRLLKPMRMSITQRVITIRQQPRLTLGLLVYFPFEAPEVPLQEIKLWQQVGEDILSDGVVLDECLPKARGEVLVFGKAYAPKGEARPAFRARIQVGAIDKSVAVIGARHWTRTGPTDPEPLAELDLRWAHAFGGSKFALNPGGTGLDEVEIEGERRRPLPQLEDPDRLIKSPDDRPAPACFGPLDVQLESRRSLMGTYGADYLETDFPGFARDLHPDFFQCAPADQRLEGYFEGGEPIELENLHAAESRIVTHVPRLRARLFLRQGEEAPWAEVSTRLDTVVLLPNAKRGIAIYRGIHPVSEDDATDVTDVATALEHLDAPRPISHYHDALARRLDPDKGYLHMLRDRDLLPEIPPDAPSFDEEAYSDMEALLARDNKMLKRSRERARREIDKLRLAFHIMGVDPDEHLPSDVPEIEQPPSMDDLADYVADVEAQAAELQKRLEEDKERAIQQAREMFEAIGIDFDRAAEEAKASGGGPPAYKAETELAQMRDLARISREGGAPMVELEEKLADPAFVDLLQRTEAGMLTAYRAGVHVMPPAPDRDEAELQHARIVVEACLTGDEPLAGRDLTGVDLRDLDLSGADLSLALLERANLSGCNLAGANLQGAILARAQLHGADLSGANLQDANLGETEADGATFAGADLRRAVLHKTQLIGADLSRTRCDAVRFYEVELSEADLTGMQVEEGLFFRCDLEAATLRGISAFRSIFVYCDLDDASFTEANLERGTFLECKCSNLQLTGANLTACAVVKCDLTNAELSGAILERLNVRGIDLTGAQLGRAVAHGADFSQANLTDANLEGLAARGALFIRTDLTRANCQRTDLMEALLMKSTLTGTRFDGANLFRANLLGARGDTATSFSDCFTKRVLFSRESSS